MIDVGTGGYDTASEALGSGHRRLASAHETLTGALGGFGGMGGSDRSSEDFVANYDSAAVEVVLAMGDMATAYGSLAVLTRASGNNHKDANAGSVYGRHHDGATDEAVPGGDPEVIASYTPPSALGGDDSDMPEQFGLLFDHLEGWAWPSADVDRLRQAATAWNNAATAVENAPSSGSTARSMLQAQRSPEIARALEAIREVDDQADEIASACRDLATACDDYATKVETTKQVVKDLAIGLAIELGATVVVSGVASFFTFGGAAAVGAGVALARIASVARKVIVALRAIKAISAVASVARVAGRMTRVTSLLRKYRTAKKIRNKPQRVNGKLPERGKPDSYGYDKNGKRMPYANSRPKHKMSTIREVFENSRNPDGDVVVPDKNGLPRKIEWEPGQSRTGPDGWDMGHNPGAEYWRLRDDYLSGRITKEEFHDQFNDPDNYTVQDPGRNRSHQDELPAGRR